jgi:hypothetical protein
MKKLSYAAAAVISVFGILSASAGESQVLTSAGLSLPTIAVPTPEAPKANQWMTLRKITVNEAQPDMNETLIGIVRGMNIDAAVKELNANGFKASAYQDNQGGYMVMVDVKGLDAADYAIGLARYYYITEVQVGQKVHSQLFGLNTKSASSAKNNQWMTLRKITINESQSDMDNTLVGMIKHGENIDKVVRELTEGGFKAEPLQDNSGGYMVMVDVTGLNAADYAVGLARYYYVTEVKVSRKVHSQLFGLN